MTSDASLAHRLMLAGKWEAYLDSLTAVEMRALPHEWSVWARPKQLPPLGIWDIWLLLAGRGFGKTRTICQWAISQAMSMPGSHGAIVGATAADVRDVLIEGEAGILACSRPGFVPTYEPSKRRVVWSNGSWATTYSADKPDRLRGPQHHWAIADEIAVWRYPDAFDMLLFGLRLGDNPCLAGATTPKPTRLIKSLIADPDCITTHGNTYENKANVAAKWLARMVRKYEGTRMGQQELWAVLLTDTPGALWTLALIENWRRTPPAEFVRVYVGVDPPGTTAECGIVVVGLGFDGHAYVLEDASLAGSPKEWAEAVIGAYDRHQADAIIAEANYGGAMVENTIRTAKGGLHVNVQLVWASRGKQTRAIPISALYERGHVHHDGAFDILDEQMSTWVPGRPSPDRLDALVWAITKIYYTDDEEEGDEVEVIVDPVSLSAW